MLQMLLCEESQKCMYSNTNITKKSKTNIYVCFYFLAKAEIYIMENEELDKVLIKLGRTIRDLRENSTNFSQDKLGLEVEMSENQIRRIEKGQTNPTVKSLLKIAQALKVDIKDLLK